MLSQIFEKCPDGGEAKSVDERSSGEKRKCVGRMRFVPGERSEGALERLERRNRSTAELEMRGRCLLPFEQLCEALIKPNRSSPSRKRVGDSMHVFVTKRSPKGFLCTGVSRADRNEDLPAQIHGAHPSFATVRRGKGFRWHRTKGNTDFVL